MPFYDYICEDNQVVLEVSHSMSEVLSNWGELCQKAGIQPGETPVSSPVKKMINRRINTLKGIPDMPCEDTGSCDLPACQTGGCGFPG